MIAGADYKKTTTEIPECFRRRDAIEISFDYLKNDLDMNRLHIYSEASAQCNPHDYCFLISPLFPSFLFYVDIWGYG